MDSYLYDDGCQEEPETPIDLYKNEQEYWEEMDRIHSLKYKGLL